ncbi:unnamed protein product [Caretta caretta]
MEGLVVNLVNIYAPQLSSRRPQFYQQVSDFLGTLDSHECLVLGGDFNTTLEERDHSGAEPSPAAANILQGIVDHHSLVDVWRDHHPDDTSTFTFVRVEAHRSHHSRLDRIYLSRFHLSQAHSSAIRPAPFSDHHLVTVTVSLRAERPGPAYWHFNNSLLEDESFVMSFREFWLAWREQWRAFPLVRRWWDLGKVRAKLFCRDYTWGTSQRRNAAIEQLEREVLEMERRLAADPKDPSLCGACREKREELWALEDHRARGAFVRSRIRLLREMDRGSRFFYALEKTRGAKKHVTCLLAEDGTPLTDPEEMCGRARDFYTSLFSPDPTDPDACEVLWEELPTVSVGDRDRLELPLTLAEFSEALRRMPTNKSPGMDGLTVEFYHAFWDILGPDLVIVWAESLQSGVLPLSCRRAVLALLPKKGDLRDLRNWRPVSLLSTDYKIVAKAISLRLGSVMADVVHPDQTYTVPGRSIFDNLFLVRDLLELGQRDGLSFALLSLDQEKAFDRVDHGYLLSTLQAFGFGPQFVSFLQVLYASAECLVRLNWTLTEPVSFGRGVQQGCPLSGQLYALAIEPFLCLLRRRMTGLVLREPELRLVLSAYADDVLLMVQDPGDLARVEACQAIYSAASSARVNWVKSSGLAVGDWRQVTHIYLVETDKKIFVRSIQISLYPILYIDECALRTHTCWNDSACVNLAGGFDCLCPSGPSCTGDCPHEGGLKRNGQVWTLKEDRCSVCSCKNGKIFCRRTACNCQNPSVDLFCCPECDTRVTSQCLDQNGHKLYRSGDNWTYSCQQCRCLEGEVDCWPLLCPNPNCEYTAISEGECCPRCVSDPCLADQITYNIRKTCVDGYGITRLSGSVWTMVGSPCTTCKCKNGNVCCSVDLDCLHNN